MAELVVKWEVVFLVLWVVAVDGNGVVWWSTVGVVAWSGGGHTVLCCCGAVCEQTEVGGGEASQAVEQATREEH